MALIRELEDHGCSLRGSVVCKYIKDDVKRCAACEYKTATPQERMQVCVDYYQEQGLLGDYPIQVTDDVAHCALCVGQKNAANTKAYAKITNKALDVKRDLADTGGRINGGEIDIEIPACTACVKNLGKLNVMSTVIVLVAGLIAAAGTFAINVAYPMEVGMLSLGIFVMMCAAGVGIYLAGMRLVRAGLAKKTVVDVLKLPALRGYAQKGWYVRGTNKVKPSIHKDVPLAMVDQRDDDRKRREQQNMQKRKRDRQQRAL